MNRCIVWVLLAAAWPAWADMTPAQAFDAGKSFGQSVDGAAAVQGAISGANAAADVPHHDTVNANSTYYAGGDGDPRTPGGNRVTECASAAYADPKQQVECNAINDLANNRAARPPLAIVPADPILVQGAAVKADPASVAGAFGGAYGACKTTTVTRPAVYEEEVCNEYKTVGEETCQKTLSVRVDVSQACTPGTWYSVGSALFTEVDAYCDPYRSDGLLALRFTPAQLSGVCRIGYADVPMAPFTITTEQELYANYEQRCDWEYCYWQWTVRNGLASDVSHWKGACTVQVEIGYAAGNHGCNDDTCSYTFKSVDWRWVNVRKNTSGPFAKPGIVVTETDTWDTGACDVLEARIR